MDEIIIWNCLCVLASISGNHNESRDNSRQCHKKEFLTIILVKHQGTHFCGGMGMTDLDYYHCYQ